MEPGRGTDDHPLDRPAWSALTTHQAALALGDRRALRFPPDIGPLAAAPDDTPESIAALAALLPPGAGLALIQTTAPGVPDGLVAMQNADCVQMLWTGFRDEPCDIDMAELTDADATEMWALAELTQPGPFHARTHTLGRFVGVRQDGKLVAMAGERMHPAGFTEVSAVCTHPDWRGRGYGAALMRAVGANIVARGEMPFLHAFAHNTSALALYQKLGFTLQRGMKLSIWARPEQVQL